LSENFQNSIEKRKKEYLECNWPERREIQSSINGVSFKT
jgi:hypothetical protein